VAVVKEYNIRRHYETKHSSKYASVVGELRQHTVSEMKKTLSSEQKSLFKVSAQAEAATRASYKVAHLVATSSRPFTDGDFAKSCMLAVCSEMCPEKVASFNSVSLSRTTMQRRIGDIAGNITKQLQDRASSFCYFSLALDESTDVGDVAQLLVFVRGVDCNFEVTQELAGLSSMHGQTTGLEIFNNVKLTVENLGLPWTLLAGVTTDGAPAMLGSSNGFIGQLKRHLNSSGHDQTLFEHHCIIHQEALCARTLKFKHVMDFVCQSVNFIRARALKHRQFQAFLEEVEAEYGDVVYHTEVRWLSRGSVLKRFVALKDEIQAFLAANGRDTKVMTDSAWLADLCFLTDITSHLNDLYAKLQGNDKLVSDLFEMIDSFQRQLQLFTAQLKAANLCHFPTCQQMSEQQQEPVDYTKYAGYTEPLQKEFSERFRDFRDKKELYVVFSDPFSTDVDNLPVPPAMQLEVLDIQCSAALRAVFREKGILEFYKCLDRHNYPTVITNALKLFSIFGSSYICEQAFSVMNINKSKLRSRLTDDNLHAVMRVACSRLSPNIEQLASDKKCNISH